MTTPNDTRKVCAAVSFESIENETAGSHCGDNDADGYTRCADILSYILSGAPYYVTVWLNKDTGTGVRLLIVIHNRS